MFKYFFSLVLIGAVGTSWLVMAWVIIRIVCDMINVISYKREIKKDIKDRLKRSGK